MRDEYYESTQTKAHENHFPLLFGLKAARIRSIDRCDSTAHSQTRTTFHPCRLNCLATRWSRLRLVAIFCLQNERLLLEGRLQRGQPCQKQPSTNKAIFLSGQAKSGLPGTFQCFRWPCNPAFLRILAIICSVLRFPVERTDAMIRDRVALETLSIARANLSARNTFGDPRRKSDLAEPNDSAFLPLHALRYLCPRTIRKEQSFGRA
jgi:hypothetical protein